MRPLASLGVTMALVGAAAPGGAQAPDSLRAPTVVGCSNKRPALSALQGLAVNVVANRVNVWAFDQDFARVGFDSWIENLRRGWKWDATKFTVNMFLHPYHGSLYHTAARANCLNFWESIPLGFLGSWTWEFFGERHRASLNDFYMTGFGGPALGEILHRVSAAVRDEEARGAERIARELAALAINPMGGLNRLVRGEWVRRGANPVDRLPESYLFGARVGGRRVEGPSQPARVTPTLLVDIVLGDVFDTEYRAPYDVVTLRAQASTDADGLNLVRTVGRLYGKELTDTESWHRHQIVINQRFEYVNNPAYNFGEQSLEVAFHSRWRSGPTGLRVKTRIAGGVVVLGAINALDAGLGYRTIDWGPGLGALAEVAIEYNGTTYVSFYNRVRYLRAVSGEPANHTLLFSGFDFTVPIVAGLGIGAYVSGHRRLSDYAELPNDERSYEETRIYLTWTLGSGRSGFAR